MSTILQALKRAEQDSRTFETRNGTPLKSHKNQGWGSSHRQGTILNIQSRHIISIGLVAGIAFLLLAGADFLFHGYFRGNDSGSEKTPEISLPPVSPSQPSLGEKKSRTPARSPIVSPKKRPSPKPAAIAEHKEIIPPPGNISVKKSDTVVRVPKPPMGIPAAHRVKKKPTKTALTKTIHTEPGVSKKKTHLGLQSPAKSGKPARKTQASVIRPMEDGLMKLQAISWAEAPTDRIVVIDNKILEENDTIQGYKVIRIGKEEVILSHADQKQKFKLIFKYR